MYLNTQAKIVTTLEKCIGNTLLVKLQRLAATAGSEVWVKLEGNNPAGSVKNRAALAMIQRGGTSRRDQTW